MQRILAQGIAITLAASRDGSTAAAGLVAQSNASENAKQNAAGLVAQSKMPQSNASENAKQCFGKKVGMTNRRFSLAVVASPKMENGQTSGPRATIAYGGDAIQLGQKPACRNTRHVLKSKHSVLVVALAIGKIPQSNASENSAWMKLRSKADNP